MGVQIALKIKENDTRREQNVCVFSGAPNGAKKDLKHGFKTNSRKKHYVFSNFDFSKDQAANRLLRISQKNINNAHSKPRPWTPEITGTMS